MPPVKSCAIAIACLTLLLPGLVRLAHAATPAHIVSGRLQLIWGDGPPGSPHQESRFRASLIDNAGHEIRLEPGAALRAAEDLYALNGQAVAVEIDETSLQAAPGAAVISKAIVPLGGPALPVTALTHSVSGSQPWVSILCKFSDVSTEPNPLGYFAAMYANQPKALDHYWREVSYNNINILGSAAYGWFTLPHPRSYYISNKHADLDKLMDDCTGVADATVNFSPFVGINQMFNDNLDCCAWGGSKYRSLDGPNRLWRVTWEPPWSYRNLAPLAHEMGHGFGLPHANNSDTDTDPYDNPWDVMSNTWDNAQHDAVYGILPKHLSIWSRDRLGWVDAADKLALNQFGTWTAIPLDFAGSAAVAGVREIEIHVPGAPAAESWTVEARQRAGVYEGNLAATAVIVHHVETGRQEPAWSFDKDNPPADVANNRGSQFLVGDSWPLGNGVHLSVTATTPTGFLVDVTVGDVLFADGFEP